MPIHVQTVAGTAGYATSIFNGDPVDLATTGLITRSSSATAAIPIGVFIGCEYEDATMGLFHRAYWPASTVIKVGTTAWAYVIDDPDALFEIQGAGSITQAMLGDNADFVLTAGSTVHGKSAVALATTTPDATATRPLRIVDFVRRPGSTVGDAFTDVIVRLNTHRNRTATGLA
jgi:hypothetical protein